jgi:hypothetical protein
MVVGNEREHLEAVSTVVRAQILGMRTGSTPCSPLSKLTQTDARFSHLGDRANAVTAHRAL